jgi:hypothetical protein
MHHLGRIHRPHQLADFLRPHRHTAQYRELNGHAEEDRTQPLTPGRGGGFDVLRQISVRFHDHTSRSGPATGRPQAGVDPHVREGTRPSASPRRDDNLFSEKKN